TQVARPLIEIFFGRLDARTVSTRGTGELLERYFPGRYELVPPGADPGTGSRPAGGPPRVAKCGRGRAGNERVVDVDDVELDPTQQLVERAADVEGNGRDAGAGAARHRDSLADREHRRST
ncbi:MAG TPA: hypothetical protein VK920_04430, partial [Solirubrobacterales bacterium]|nr:hypothetical protein [Solirubrobacterales bacterium]